MEPKKAPKTDTTSTAGLALQDAAKGFSQTELRPGETLDEAQSGGAGGLNAQRNSSASALNVEATRLRQLSGRCAASLTPLQR